MRGEEKRGVRGAPVRIGARRRPRGAARRRAQRGPRARGAGATRAPLRTSRERRRALVSGRDSTRAIRLRDSIDRE